MMFLVQNYISTVIKKLISILNILKDAYMPFVFSEGKINKKIHLHNSLCLGLNKVQVSDIHRN